MAVLDRAAAAADRARAALIRADDALEQAEQDVERIAASNNRAVQEAVAGFAKMEVSERAKERASAADALSLEAASVSAATSAARHAKILLFIVEV